MVIENITEEKLVGADIRVIGVGGGGGNAVNTMIQSRLSKVRFIAANTDAQVLERSMADMKIHLGREETKGLGAGGDPTKGKKAAMESRETIMKCLDGADMVFVTAGMGGGTGTGAAPIVAEAAKEVGALTVAVVTKPFNFEGRKRMVAAEHGIDELRSKVDTLIVIPNQKIVSSADRNMTFQQAFRVADDVLRRAIQGVSDLINVHGLVNLDFADVKTTMSNSGMALMGTGLGRGPNKAIDAVENAIFSPLLEDTSIKGGRSMLINVTCGPDITIHEVTEASMKIAEHADEEANIIWGAVIDEAMEDEMRVTIIATRFEREQVGRAPVRSATLSSSTASRNVTDMKNYRILNHEDGFRSAVGSRTPSTSFGRPMDRGNTESGVPSGTKDTPSILRQGPD